MKKHFISAFVLFVICMSNVNAQDTAAAGGAMSAEELAKQLANPVASLISVPLQNNFDFGVGPFDGFKYNLNIQPVIPVSINDKWNMISRTVIPVISQSDVTGPGKSEFGLGDIAQSLYFSPKESKNGLVWGLGPILLFPTATDDALGAQKWGAGPNALLVKIKGQWTYGGIVNHTWSYAGSGLNDINATFFQPFMTFASKTGSSYTIAAENTQLWDNKLFGGFVGAYYSKVTSIGTQMLQVGGGPKVYYGNNPFNPEWGLRANVILLFPN